MFPFLILMLDFEINSGCCEVTANSPTERLVFLPPCNRNNTRQLIAAWDVHKNIAAGIRVQLVLEERMWDTRLRVSA